MSQIRDLLGTLLCLVGLHNWKLSHRQHVPIWGEAYDICAELCVRACCRGRTYRARIVPGEWPWDRKDRAQAA